MLLFLKPSTFSKVRLLVPLTITSDTIILDGWKPSPEYVAFSSEAPQLEFNGIVILISQSWLPNTSVFSTEVYGQMEEFEKIDRTISWLSKDEVVNIINDNSIHLFINEVYN